MDQDMLGEFQGALDKYQSFRENQLKTTQDLTVTQPNIVTSAPPPFEKTMRSTGGMNMNGTVVSGMGGNQSENSKSPRDRNSPRTTMRPSQADELKRKTEQDNKEAEEAKQFIEGDMAELEFENGLQIYKNELESKLTFMQKLQLRIAGERKIQINGLKGDEFQILKEFKKLEERKELLNTVDDFFDPKYDYTYDMAGVNSHAVINQMGNESAQ